jgi:hypothetical protein
MLENAFEPESGVNRLNPITRSLCLRSTVSTGSSSRPAVTFWVCLDVARQEFGEGEPLLLLSNCITTASDSPIVTHDLVH